VAPEKVFGRYCFDVMLLKMSGVPREVLRPDDFASDALPLKLLSAGTVRALLELETNDTGNKMVRVRYMITYSLLQLISLYSDFNFNSGDCIDITFHKDAFICSELPRCFATGASILSLGIDTVVYFLSFIG
jgi:hypothetical protein